MFYGPYYLLIFLPFIIISHRVTVSIPNLNYNIWNLELSICGWWLTLTLVWWHISLCMVIICYLVDLVWGSWGSRLGNSERSWVFSLLLFLFQKNQYFYQLFFFNQGRGKRIMFTFSLPPFLSWERKRQTDTERGLIVPYLNVIAYFEVSSSFGPLFITSHALGRCLGKQWARGRSERWVTGGRVFCVCAVPFKDVPDVTASVRCCKWFTQCFDPF